MLVFHLPPCTQVSKQHRVDRICDKIESPHRCSFWVLTPLVFRLLSMINPEVSELCVYVTASECDPCGLVWTCHKKCVVLVLGRKDLTMAMVPAEGVAADLSHLNMKCKVQLGVLVRANQSMCRVRCQGEGLCIWQGRQGNWEGQENFPPEYTWKVLLKSGKSLYSSTGLQ